MEKKEFDTNPEMDDLLADLEDDWGIDSIKNLRKTKQEITFKTKFVGYLNLVLIFLALILFWVYYFINLSIKPKNELGEYEKMYFDTVKNNLINLFVDSSSTVNISSKDSTIEQGLKMKKYIQNPWILFYDKLDFKTSIEEKSYKDITSLYNRMEKYKNLLVQYKFFPQQLQDIVKDIKVLPILTTLNAIKLYVIDYVYIKAGLFKEQVFDFVYTRSTFPRTYGLISSDDLLKIIESDIQYFRDQGAYEYLKNIYFNYMYDSTDTLANSYFVTKFEKVFNKRLLIRYNFFKEKYPSLNKQEFMADYIKFIQHIYDRTLSLQKEVDTWILPVDVQLLSYNPKTEELAFSIKLMLAPEISSKIWPVKLLSDIVTLLRESRLIIWKTISYNNVKIRKITKRIWWYKLTFLSTEQKFSTSVQPQIELEVTDRNY